MKEFNWAANETKLQRAAKNLKDRKAIAQKNNIKDDGAEPTIENLKAEYLKLGGFIVGDESTRKGVDEGSPKVDDLIEYREEEKVVRSKKK